MKFLPLAILFSACAPDPLAAPPPSELSVTRVIVYQNGIGYFERRGEAHGGALTLRIRPDQIGDLLKTLTVVSLNGGQAVSVALPVDKTRARQLADLPEQVRNSGGLQAIAQAFRGARVNVSAKSGSAEGRLLGVEGERLSVLTDEGTLRAFPIADVSAMRLLDRSLELGLRKSLDSALGEASWKPVELTIRLDGDEKRDVVVSYVVEMPMWKPAYRIILGGAKALLQGWAVVDNLSGEDWHGVKLSLASGTPLAFRYDLYAPRYRQRPDLTPSGEAPTAAIPEAVDVEGAVQAEMEKSSLMPMQAPSAPPPGAASSGYGAGPSSRNKSAKRYSPSQPKKSAAYDRDEAPMKEMAPVTDAQLEQGFKSVVSSTAVGALYRYDVQAPVTVRDRQSALVALVNARVPGEEAWLFRVGQDNEHPYRATRFDNQTGEVIERGPVAIYRDGTFLGEALSGRIEAGGSAFLPFALDGRVRLDLREQSSEEGVRLVKFVSGNLLAETKEVTRFTYEVSNASGEAMTLWVARQKRPGWSIVGVAAEKLREQSGLYYVPMALPKTGKTTLEVREETPAKKQVEAMSDVGRHVLALYVQNPDADPVLKEKLKGVLASFERMSAIDEKIASLNEQKGTLAEREGEVRSNLDALGSFRNTPLRAQLEGSIADLEKKLNRLSNDIVTLTIERQKLRDETIVILKTLNL